MKRITRIRCIVPFTRFSVHQYGYCYSCCPSWTRLGHVGRLTSDISVMEIWNNQTMQYIRKAILKDELEKVCDFAIKNEYLDLAALKDDDDPNLNRVIEQIAAGEVVLDGPPHTFQVANSGRCNLKCTMCESRDRFHKNDDGLDETLFNRIIPGILPKVSRLFLTGNGEVFFNPYSRKFLQTLDSSQYPALKIQILTNGILLTPEFWETIRHHRFDSILVSVDAASKEVYQSIRKNGSWDVLRRNLEFISELRRQDLVSEFAINFIVMRSNYREMKDFVSLGLSLGCDRIFFQKIFGLADIRENINFTRDRKVLTEVADVLADPIFSHPEVNTALVDEYRKYQGQSAGFWGNLVTKCIEGLLYYPIRAAFLTAKYLSLPWIHEIYELFRKKRVTG